jgi:hypothetical protein
MAVVDQHRPCVGMLETFSRFSGRFRSVSARVSGFNVTDGNTDSRGGVGVIDYAPRQGYNLAVIITPYRLTCVSRGATFARARLRAGGTAVVRATIA